ncbi:MAG: sulfotransferase [Oscillatoriales cyanobacterium]|nr:MAG: sulfotransferase [Oscillatoriales cyanobacterium]
MPYGMPPRVLLVGGAPRSGTTLLQALLCSGPDTNPLMGEAIDLAHLVQAYAHSRDLHRLGETTDYFQDLNDLRQFYRQPIAALLQRVWQRYDHPACLVLKSPALTPHLPELLDLIPHAQALVSVRDPRDGAASLRAIGQRYAADQSASVAPADPQATAIESQLAQQPIERLGQYFCNHYATVLACRDADLWDRLRFVRYEALVAHLDAAIAQLQAFTGLQLHCDPAQPWQRSAINFQHLPDRYRAWWSGQGYGDRISSASIGRYRQHLSPSEIQAIQRVCGDWMQRFGYGTPTEPGDEPSSSQG